MGASAIVSKEESEWTYYNIVFLHNNTSTITFAAEADTDYIIELIARYSGKVCDMTEIHTEAFATSNIEVEVVDITASDAVIRVSVGAYTGEKQYICARVSYIDSMGSIQTSTGYISAGSIADGSIDLQLGNLTAGTEYNDLTVELDDTNAMELQYAACRMQVSFETPDSVLTAEQIHVTVKPDADRAYLALLQIALQDVPEGIYSYTVKCRVAGGIEWSDGGKPAGKLASYNDYADERSLGILAYNSKYEVQVTVDGIVKMLYFTTVPAEVIPEVEIQPLMQGVKLAVSLPGAPSGTYTVSAQYYDEISHCWDTLVYSDYDDTLMTEENGWRTTIVYSSDRVRPNAENRWKITIKNSLRSTVYEKYFTFEAVKQDISVTAESVKFNSLFIRASMALRDESVMHSRCRMFYREKGTAEWHGAVDCTYGYENGGPIYLQGLQEDTEYEIRLVATYYPDDILAQAVFRTLKDTRRLPVYIDNCRYTSAQANWGFESDNSTLNNDYVFTYCRKKGTTMWSLINYVQTGTAHAGQTSLTDLEPETTYEVLVELKDQYSGIQGKDVIVDAKTEFTTIAMDHVLTAAMKDEEYKDTRFTITLDVLKKPEILTLPETYTWLDYSNKLADTGLPEHWQWKEKDTLLYETGRQVFTAYYAEAGYYPYETKVPVHIAKAGDNLPVADGDYSAGKKAYIMQKGKPLQVRINALPEICRHFYMSSMRCKRPQRITEKSARQKRTRREKAEALIVSLRQPRELIRCQQSFL